MGLSYSLILKGVQVDVLVMRDGNRGELVSNFIIEIVPVGTLRRY
jgi:hypothetical protein